MFYCCYSPILCFFFFNDTATTEIYTLSLHDALPIYAVHRRVRQVHLQRLPVLAIETTRTSRSEEHTSELQSHSDLVCRLLLEKKKKKKQKHEHTTKGYTATHTQNENYKTTDARSTHT